MRKSIVFLVLGIPVLIALILNLFGKNTFEIPIYYEEGISSEECNIDLKDQYKVGDFQTQDGRQISIKGVISIMYFQSYQNEHLVQMTRDLERIFSTKPESKLFKVYALTNIDNAPESIRGILGTTILTFDNEQLDRIARCKLFIPQSDDEQQLSQFSTIVLMDGSGRIRGYFKGWDEEEIDRLSAEVDILQLEVTED